MGREDRRRKGAILSIWGWRSLWDISVQILPLAVRSPGREPRKEIEAGDGSLEVPGT